MRTWTRIVAVTAALLLVGAFTLAVAAGEKRPAPQSIPTVVTNKTVATLAPADTIGSPTSAVSPITVIPPIVSADAPGKVTATRPHTTSSAEEKASPESPDQREVVTPKVRDESDGDDEHAARTSQSASASDASARGHGVAVASAASTAHTIRRAKARHHSKRVRARAHRRSSAAHRR